MKKILYIVLFLVFIFILLPMVTLAESNINDLINNATILTTDILSLETDKYSYNYYNLPEGTYVVDGTIDLDYRLYVNGNTTIILKDNSLLNATKGINVGIGQSLTIYSESLGNNMGKIIATGGDSEAGIGGSRDGAMQGSSAGSAGTITINGGYIEATGSYDAAGIGGGCFGSSGTITINNGTIIATAEEGAGIGNGFENAYSGSITINGGNITSTSKRGAAIGGGSHFSSTGTIIINDGTINASAEYVAIGGGMIGDLFNNDTNTDKIEINGGTITATVGTYGIGIGATEIVYGSEKIVITGGTINASGGSIGIGGWYLEDLTNQGKNDMILISGGNITAEGSEDFCGIGSGDNMHEDGFSTTSDGNAIIHTSSLRVTDGITSAVVFIGDSGTVYGSPVLNQNLVIDEGETLLIPSTSILTISRNYKIINNGTIDNQGKIIIESEEDNKQEKSEEQEKNDIDNKISEDTKKIIENEKTQNIEEEAKKEETKEQDNANKTEDEEQAKDNANITKENEVQENNVNITGENPITFDNIIFYIVLSIISILGIIGTTFYKKIINKNQR